MGKHYIKIFNDGDSAVRQKKSLIKQGWTKVNTRHIPLKNKFWNVGRDPITNQKVIFDMHGKPHYNRSVGE